MHLIFRATSQNPVAIIHIGVFQMCISLKKIHCHPSLLRMQSVFRFPAKITLLLSHASVFISLQKPILSISAYFMFPMFFSYMSMSQETCISHRRLCSHSYFPTLLFSCDISIPDYKFQNPSGLWRFLSI